MFHNKLLIIFIFFFVSLITIIFLIFSTYNRIVYNKFIDTEVNNIEIRIDIPGNSIDSIVYDNENPDFDNLLSMLQSLEMNSVKKRKMYKASVFFIIQNEGGEILYSFELYYDDDEYLPVQFFKGEIDSSTGNGWYSIDHTNDNYRELLTSIINNHQKW